MADTFVPGQRTRHAILDAAADVFARDPRATIGDIAAAAGVGRATVHRYFSDRGRLHAALVTDSWAKLHGAIRDAALDAGSAEAAIERLVAAMVHVGNRILFLFATTEGASSAEDAPVAAEVDDAVLAMIRRGQDNGEFDGAVPAEWIERVLWSVVYAGLHAARDHVVPRHGVVPLVAKTLRGAIALPARSLAE
jgi:AcrR family transcriptional regulator